MTELLILLTAIIFFFIGRLSTKPMIVFKRKQEETIDDILEKAKKPIKNKIKSGLIKLKSPEEFTPEAEQDKKLEEAWIKSGMADRLLK